MRLHPCCPGVLFAGEDAQFLYNRQASPSWLGIHTYTHTILDSIMTPELSIEGQRGVPWVQ